MPLKVLIIGAGLCGPAAATLLRRADPENHITVLERHEGIRHNGLQIDFRAWGVSIMQRLGLLEDMRKLLVKEEGTSFVDSNNKAHAVFGVVGTGGGQQSFTSDFEIMRGDLSQLLYEASRKDPKTGVMDGEGKDTKGDGPGVRYRFGTWATALTQDENGVDVTLSDGTTDRYDLVIGADGQWSRTRRMIFGEEAGLDAFKRMGVYVAYFTVPRVPEDDSMARFYLAGNGINILSRPVGVPGKTQVYFMVRTSSEEAKNGIERKSVEEQKAVFDKLIRGSRWQTERFLKGMHESTDFYGDSLGQVKAPAIIKGRVALLGDAACCASPITGMGTTASLLTSWMLVGELMRSGGNVPVALEAYNVNARPYINELQKFPPIIPRIMTLQSRLAVAVIYFFMSLFIQLKLDKILVKLIPDDKGGMPLPEYPELNLPEAN
ncbi:FAD/NAD(P)-binding domain-containing protein [Hypoxylon trugodes]|uniref:FAD/NAD(P)-binding domain-containing protein n=1 Tax=Hypoxylon trugodes TaxID=326681 RepID=UPI00218F2758|nr:FAD/NAD(P)-binding domain-containing protein [Hypoxylon trugodes]KAI1387555.1 FAD/NAD(P)-binding domain-containing protein [Hypoxylon trugodes]